MDNITISSSLMFSMKYRMSLDGIRNEVLYNNIRKADYDLCDDYQERLEITSRD